MVTVSCYYLELIPILNRILAKTNWTMLAWFTGISLRINYTKAAPGFRLPFVSINTLILFFLPIKSNSNSKQYEIFYPCRA